MTSSGRPATTPTQATDSGYAGAPSDPNSGTTSPPLGRVPAAPAPTDFEAVLGARREYGAALEPALVDSFATKIADEIARQEYLRARQVPAKAPGNGPALALGIISVLTMIPLSAIALGTEQAWVLLIMAPAVALINIAFAWGQRRREQD